MIIIEENFDSQVLLMEASGEKKTYLEGVMAEAEKKNRNGRIYDLKEITQVSNMINAAAEKGQHILGTLDHEPTLEVKLENVSHRLIRSEMKENQMICRAEIIEKHPKGAIAKALIDSGIKLGMSTRGAGSVNENTGRVNNYRFVTIDLVATPSCASAYPESITEALKMNQSGMNLMEMSENYYKDPIAQKYFQIELKKFIDSLSTK